MRNSLSYGECLSKWGWYKGDVRCLFGRQVCIVAEWSPLFLWENVICVGCENWKSKGESHAWHVVPAGFELDPLFVIFGALEMKSNRGVNRSRRWYFGKWVPEFWVADLRRLWKIIFFVKIRKLMWICWFAGWLSLILFFGCGVCSWVWFCRPLYCVSACFGSLLYWFQLLNEKFYLIKVL